VLALPLWLQVTGLLWNLLDNSLLLVEALFWSWLELTTGWTAKFPWDLLTFSLGAVLLHNLLLGVTDLLGPLGTFLLSGVSLGDILALLLVDGLAINDIILNFMFVEPGLALGLVDGLTFNWTLAFADKWSVAELDGLFGSDLLVLDETALLEVFLALLFLLGLEVSGVGGVAKLAVAMLALNHIIVLSLLDHDDLIDTPLAGSSNGSNIQSNIIVGSLTGTTSWEGKTSKAVISVAIMMIVMVMVSGMTLVGTSSSITLTEWEGSPQVLATALSSSLFGSEGTAGHQQQETKPAKSVHVY
jgi:hypothetical protein